MLPMARMGDITYGICTAHSPSPITVTGMIISSQMRVLVNGMPAATMIDMVIGTCGHTGTIISGSGTVLIGGLPAARLTDTFVGSYSGTIISSSGTVFCA